MSGENESITPGAVDKLDEILDQFEKDLGIVPRTKPNPEVELLMRLTRAELKVLSPEDCSEAAIILEQYSFYIQRVFNLDKARHDWCVEQVNRLIAPTLNQYGTNYTKYDEKRMLAVKDNDVASKLDFQRIKSMNRMNRLEYLSGKVGSYAHKFNKLAESKAKSK